MQLNGEREICLKKTVSLLKFLCNRILYVVIAITIPPHITSPKRNDLLEEKY